MSRFQAKLVRHDNSYVCERVRGRVGCLCVCAGVCGSAKLAGGMTTGTRSVVSLRTVELAAPRCVWGAHRQSKNGEGGGGAQWIQGAKASVWARCNGVDLRVSLIHDFVFECAAVILTNHHHPCFVLPPCPLRPFSLCLPTTAVRCAAQKRKAPQLIRDAHQAFPGSISKAEVLSCHCDYF